ncbi:MAG TPA: hypothetical protein VEH51_09895 [Burkholderiales bacterium]|nr:hypothetical protein [Burkholderiales bacterium]
MRAFVVTLCLAAAFGCSSQPPASAQSQSPAAQEAARKNPYDALCMQDCMSDQANEKLCHARCAY